MKIVKVLISIHLFIAQAVAQDPTGIINLGSGEAPDEVAVGIGKERTRWSSAASGNVLFIQNVSVPTPSLFPAELSRISASAVLVRSGDVCNIPTYEHEAALQDEQRAEEWMGAYCSIPSKL